MADYCNGCGNSDKWWVCADCQGGDYYKAAKLAPKSRRKPKANKRSKNGAQAK